jgi:hypothetical protein
MLRRQVPLLAAIALLAVHFSNFDFRDQPIVTDARYYLYFAWQLGEGAVVHRDLFDNKTQLTSYVGAGLFALARAVGTDPLRTIRVGYLAITALAGLLSFFVFRRLGGGSGTAGLLATIAWCAFGFLGTMAAIGNLPKLWMGVAALVTALLVDRRRWILAGIAGSLAFMDWQIGVVAWLGAFVSALALGRDRGWRPALEVAAGGAAGLAPFLLYYALTGALGATIDQVIAASFFRGTEVAGNSSLARRLASIASATRTGLGEQQWLFYASGLGIPVVLRWLRAHRELGLLLPLAVYHFGVLGFSLIDFQWYGDYFLVVQSAAFFLAALWVAAWSAIDARTEAGGPARRIGAIAICLLATAVARPGPLRPEIELRRVKPANEGASLADQQEVADALRERIGDGRVVFLDHSEMLFLMRKRNETPVIFWNRPTWSTHRRAGETIVETAQRIVVEADADFAVVPRARRRSLAQPGSDERVIEWLDFSPALAGYEIETFRSSNGRFEVALGVRGDRGEDLDDASVERLRALGYADVGEALPEGATVGVRHHVPERATSGLTLYTDATACATHLVELDGEIVHGWSGTPCYRWDNTVLLPDGDLLVATREAQGRSRDEADAARYLVRLAWDGRVRWRLPLAVHHDVDWTPHGHIVAMTHRFRKLPRIHASVPVRDHLLTRLTGDARWIEEISLWDAFEAAEVPARLQPVRPRRFEGSREIDLFHSNAVEWMRQEELIGTHPLFREDSVLVCIRNQDLLAILDWSERRVIWSWGGGELSGPHDATLLPSGNILAFDNGLGRDWSRVVEVDPRSDRIVWEYRAAEPTSFYSRTRGASQRLANGNTLVTESEKGRIFELAPDGEVVWDYVNPDLSEAREPGVIVRARRLEGLDLSEIRRRLGAGEPLPLVD